MDKETNCKRECDKIICSIALEETALSHILNAEGEKIQKAVSIATSVEELLKINCSVDNMLVSVTNLEIALFGKLRSALCCKCGCPPVPPEPPIPPVPPCRYREVCIEGVVTDRFGNRLCNARVCAFGKNSKEVTTNCCGYYVVKGLVVCENFSIYAECNGYRSIVCANNDSHSAHYTCDLQIKC